MSAFKNRSQILQSRITVAKCKPGKRGLTALLGLLFLVLAMAALTACRSTSPSPTFPDLREGTNSIQLREGDVIRVTFENATNLNMTQTVPFDGIITFPLIEPIKVAGKTIVELESALTVLYESQIKTSEIKVARIASAASYSIGGAVLKPGKFPLDRPITVLEAVMEAGGVDHARAKLSEVIVLRIENQKPVNYPVNLKRALQGKENSLFYLKPFDIIFVPEKTFNF
jgi:polysaccharide export outer membrane protein